MALCLNTTGQQRVRDSRVLEAFVPIFTSRKYLRALGGDTPPILGSGACNAWMQLGLLA